MIDSNPLPIDTGRGLSIYYLSKNLYSKYNPKKIPQKIAQDFIAKEKTLYFVPSPLLLYGLKEIIEKLPESSAIIAIEIDQKLMKITRELSESIDSEKIQILRLESREKLKFVIDKMDLWKFRRSEILVLNNSYHLYQKQYDMLFNFTSSILSTFWRNRLTINKLGPLWIKNILINSQSHRSGLPDNKGKSIVICGAGASLETSLNLLKENRDSLYIMAVDTALSTLVTSDIIPDAVFALEAQFYNLGDFYDTIDKKIDLISDITSYPPVSRKLKGNRYYFSSEFFENNLLRRFEQSINLSLKIPPLGSVGVAAVYCALQFFKNKIYLTGLDFSFVPGKSHAKGSPYSKTLLRTSSRVQPPGSYHVAMNRPLQLMEGKISGKKITTDFILDSYGKLLKEIVDKEHRIFDLSDEGYPLGIPLINRKDFTHHLKNFFPKGSSIQAQEYMENTSKFLENERDLLKILIKQWDLFSTGSSQEMPETLLEALETVDYIYIDFPDSLPHPRNELSFVSRAVVSARKYLDLINKLIKNPAL